MKKHYFLIKGQFDWYEGEAAIVGTVKDGINYATPLLPPVDTGELKACKIGIYAGYLIYESYRDSGSDDYVYFAIKIKRHEKI